MKNIFKLGSVFMALALLVSTLLLTGVLVSADPTTDTVAASWSVKDITAIRKANIVAVVNGTAGTDDKGNDINFGPFARANFDKITSADYYIELAVTGEFSAVNKKDLAYAGTLFANTLATIPANGMSCTNTDTTVTFSSKGITLAKKDGVTVTADAPNVGVNVSGFVSAGTSATGLTFTIYKRAGTTEAKSTATVSATDTTKATSAPTAPEVNGDKVIARWTTPAKFDGTSTNISIKPDKVTGNDGTEDMLFGAFASAHFTEMYATDNYVEIAFTGDFSNLTGTPAYAGNLFSKALTVGNGTTDTLTYSKTDSKIVFSSKTVGLSKKSNLGSNGKIDITGLVGAVFGADDTLTFTIYEKGAETTATETATETSATETSATETSATETSATETSATETSATETSATETSATETSATETSATETSETQASEPSETQPMALVETVLVENNAGATKTLKAGKTDAWFLVVNEVKADIAANGPIDPDKGEYYQITVTGSVDNGDADFHLGEGLDWNEYWGESGSITTEPSTVVATIPVAIPAEGIGDVYLADSGEAGHTLTWTYAKVSVLRLGAAPETSATATETSASETETSASETETSATATETSASESETSASETETTPSATETEASASQEKTGADATATGTDPVISYYGDVNNDGDVTMEDVLALRRYLAGLKEEINLEAADVNVDGKINLKDVLMIRKFLTSMIDRLGA